MAESLILRNCEGRIVGYVLLQEDCIFYRLKGQGELGKLFLLDEMGTQAGLDVCCNAQEKKAEVYTHGLSDALIVVNEEIWAYSSRKAMENFIGNRNTGDGESFSKNLEEKRETERNKDDALNVSIKGEQRWPPPPCRPQARYVSGVWTEE